MFILVFYNIKIRYTLECWYFKIENSFYLLLGFYVIEMLPCSLVVTRYYPLLLFNLSRKTCFKVFLRICLTTPLTVALRFRSFCCVRIFPLTAALRFRPFSLVRSWIPQCPRAIRFISSCTSRGVLKKNRHYPLKSKHW